MKSIHSLIFLSCLSLIYVAQYLFLPNTDQFSHRGVIFWTEFWKSDLILNLKIVHNIVYDIVFGASKTIKIGGTALVVSLDVSSYSRAR